MCCGSGVSVLELGKSGRPLAVIKLSNGKKQSITWKSLQQFIKTINSNNYEHLQISSRDQVLIFSITTASGQCGVIAVWDSGKQSWVHIQDGSFCLCALYLPELNCVLGFHHVQSWGMKPYYMLTVSRYGVKDAFFDKYEIVHKYMEPYSSDKSVVERGVTCCASIYESRASSVSSSAVQPGLYYSANNNNLLAVSEDFSITIPVDDIKKLL